MKGIPVLYIVRSKQLKRQLIEFIHVEIEDNEEPEDLSAEQYIATCLQYSADKHGADDFEPVLVLRLPEGATVDKPDMVLGCYFAEVYLK